VGQFDTDGDKKYNGSAIGSAQHGYSRLHKALAQCDNMDCTAGSSVATETSSFNAEHGTINGHPIS
jgi:hypothetical protein